MNHSLTRSGEILRYRSEAKQVALARSILARAFENVHPRDFDVHLWNGETIPSETGTSPRFTLVLKRPGALRRMFLPPNDLAFVSHYVFPDGELVPIHDALAYAEGAGFEVCDVESWREHYARTLRHWVARLEAHRDEARRVVDERTYRVWRLYMAGSAHAFDTARVNVYQALFCKPDAHGVNGLPLTREDWYMNGEIK